MNRTLFPKQDKSNVFYSDKCHKEGIMDASQQKLLTKKISLFYFNDWTRQDPSVVPKENVFRLLSELS